MGNYKIYFYLSQGAYRLGIVAYKVDLHRCSRNYAVHYAENIMRGNTNYYTFEVVEY